MGQPAGFRRFTGQHFDVEADLYYYGARFYDGALGRFISPDTIVPAPGNPQALNRYSYVLNNPLRYTDPTGHSACMALAPAGPAFAVCQLGEQILRHGPQIVNLIQQLTIFAPQAPAHVDQVAQAVQGSGNRSASSNAGNTADPGGLGPNDPWGKFNSLLGQGKSEIDAAVQASTQGSGDRFVIGKYVSPEEFQRTGQVGYIQEVQARGGRYFDAGKTLWARLDQSGMAGEVNRQVIRRQMEGGISRIELAGETIQQALSRKGSWTVEEIKWIREFARVFGYVEDATGWTKGP